MFAIQERVGANQDHHPGVQQPTWYEYSTKRFNGWFSADNPVAKPQVHPDTPERLLRCCPQAKQLITRPLRASSPPCLPSPSLPGLGELARRRAGLPVKVSPWVYT